MLVKLQKKSPPFPQMIRSGLEDMDFEPRWDVIFLTRSEDPGVHSAFCIMGKGYFLRRYKAEGWI